MTKLMISVAICLILSACAEWNSIYKTKRVTDNVNVVTVDAKQRSTYFVKREAESAKGAPDLRLCAEPPPDVFSALASSLSASAGLSGKAASREINAQIAAALSENASTIERSQTVNVLRESMYRTCERYMSGAISKEEFMIQAARDQRTIVQVLAIEQLTGAARAQATALTTIAQALGSGTTEEAILQLGAARKDQDAKQKALADAVAAHKLLPPDVGCDAIPAAAVAPVTAEQLSAKRAQCEKVAAADKALKAADAHYVAMKDALAAQQSLAARVEGKLNSASFSPTAVSAEIGARVAEIVAHNANFNEVAMTCVVLIRADSSKLSIEQKAVIRECAKLIPGMYRMEQSVSNAVLARQVMIQSQFTSEANKIWACISTDNALDPTKSSTTLKKAKITLFADELAEFNGYDQSGFTSWFTMQEQHDQDALKGACP